MEFGDVDALASLGLLYERGYGKFFSKKKAIDNYRMAAERGHAIAQCRLGLCFATGDGVTQDYFQAAHFCGLSANQGFTTAEYIMSILVGQDTAEATSWLERAAAKGHEAATRALAARARW